MMTPGKSLHAASATLHVQKRKTATIIGAKSQLDPSKARTCYSPVLTRQAVSLVRGYGHVSRSYELMEDYDDSDNDHVEENDHERQRSDHYPRDMYLCNASKMNEELADLEISDNFLPSAEPQQKPKHLPAVKRVAASIPRINNRHAALNPSTPVLGKRQRKQTHKPGFVSTLDHVDEPPLRVGTHFDRTSTTKPRQEILPMSSRTTITESTTDITIYTEKSASATIGGRQKPHQESRICGCTGSCSSKAQFAAQPETTQTAKSPVGPETFVNSLLEESTVLKRIVEMHWKEMDMSEHYTASAALDDFAHRVQTTNIVSREKAQLVSRLERVMSNILERCGVRQRLLNNITIVEAQHQNKLRQICLDDDTTRSTRMILRTFFQMDFGDVDLMLLEAKVGNDGD